MSIEDPTPEEEPSSRLAGRMPWILLGIGGLAILAVIGAIIAMRRGDQVNVNVANQATSTPAVIGVPVTVVVTATPAGPPTLVIPTPTQPGPPTPIIVTAVPKEPPTLVPQPPAAPPAGSTGQSGEQLNATPVPPPTSAPPTVAPTATTQAFRGEVSPSGGLANSRTSFDGTYGPPAGETPNRLVVYKRGTDEYQILFSPDPPRALLVALKPANGAQTTLDSARDAVRRLLPNDVQRRTPQPEGNDSFVVERYHSATLGQAIPPDVAREWGGQPGDLVVIFQRVAGSSDRIERTIVGIGDNVDRARQRAGA